MSTPPLPPAPTPRAQRRWNGVVVRSVFELEPELTAVIGLEMGERAAGRFGCGGGLVGGEGDRLGIRLGEGLVAAGLPAGRTAVCSLLGEGSVSGGCGASANLGLGTQELPMVLTMTAT